jgi:hypothetical protein
VLEAFMNHPLHPVLLGACALFLCAAVHPPSLAAGAAEVVAQQLNGPKVSKKVSAVLWTRRPDRYTLQVVFPREGRILPLVDGRKLVGPATQNPAITLWLLRADGTAISATKETTLREKQGFIPIEVAYSVPLTVGDQAVAAAIRIDDEYYIEPLENLSGK